MRESALVGVMIALLCAVGAARAEFTPVVGPYLQIQQALSADSVDGVKDAAGRIAAGAAELGGAGEAIRAAAVALSQATEVVSARAAFGRLGDAILIYAKDTAATLGRDVRVAYCPMARKYWLQKGDDVRNPFYGPAMLDCGRIVPEIPTLRKKVEGT